MRYLLIIAMLAGILSLSGVLIQIGNGTVTNQGLPIEPWLSYSYSQQLFKANEINTVGAITSVGFQYHVVSTTFFEASREVKIYLGSSPRSRMEPWVPLDSLTLVYDGVLSMDYYSSALPGDGWLTIPLQTAFILDGTSNLVIAYDENSFTGSSNSDDFLSTNVAETMGILYKSNTVNPDPANPPTSNCYSRNSRSNLRLQISAIQHIPVSPTPADGMLDVPISGLTLHWFSDATEFDVFIGNSASTLQQVANQISSSQCLVSQALSMNQEYYWQVIGHIGTNAYPSAVWHFTTTGEQQSAPRNLTASFSGDHVSLAWLAPLAGTVAEYEVYRNNAALVRCTPTHYEDHALNAGITYVYQVRAVNPGSILSPPSNAVSIFVPEVIPNLIVQESFEAYDSFSTQLTNWQNIDMDNSITWEWDELSFPGEGDPMPWMVIDPTQTVPPMASATPAHGSKMLMAMSSYYPPNNDWLISPGITLGNSPAALSFSARSYTAAYGLERLKVLISTTDSNPSSFTEISTSPYLSIPATWTDLQIDLSTYQNQHVYVAIQCISWDAFALFLDNIIITGAGGMVPIEDELLAPARFSIYPNPAHSYFRVESDSKAPFDLGIYDLRGRRIASEKQLTAYDSSLHKLQLCPGIYFIRIDRDGHTETRKLAIIK